MKHYDPEKPPIPSVWLGLDEAERIKLIQDYHEANQVPLSDVRAHSVFHAIVENQAAMTEDDTVRQALARLIREGLSRHDAVHAVATVLADHMHALHSDPGNTERNNQTYLDAVRELTAAAWLSDYLE